MNLEALREYVMSKPRAVETFPFGEGTHVFKVNHKMFALIGSNNNLMMLNLKCDPDESVAVRDIFPAIKPGYHMDKRHWISIYFDGTVPEGEVKRLIDNSFLLVVSKMSQQDQQSILVHI